jgi:putative flavoprotein involved in K+ transport
LGDPADARAPQRTYGRVKRTSEDPMSESFETIIIGGGQAGLATGYHLAERDRSFVILEANERIGDSWRRHYDSLRLYSPARFNALPGWAGALDPWTYPTKDEMADYLEAYAKRFELPVIPGVRVERLSRDGGRYLVRAGAHRLTADNVVVASGTFQDPIVPELAAHLDPAILQLHSSEYRNPSQLRPGPVLVVGAAHSGADIAHEVAASHPTVLSGRVNGEMPFDIEGRVAHVALPVLWRVANHVLTVRTPIGRKVRVKVRAHGGPLLRVKRAHLREAGVDHVEARVEGVSDGKPVLADGQVLDVANVVWCTGFGKDVGWIDVPVTGEDGWPEQTAGAVESSPGLFFVGLPFLFSFASMLVGGVGRDAERVATQIAGRAPREDEDEVSYLRARAPA